MIFRRGPVVTGSDHQRNPSVLNPVVHPVHNFSLRGKTAGRAQTHIDYVYTQLHCILQSRENPFVSGPAFHIGKHLENSQLRVGRYAGQRLTVGGGNTGYVGSMALAVIDIRVMIGIVILERNLFTDVKIIHATLRIETQIL